jgi:mono/diheme cytochrome c family protein
MKKPGDKSYAIAGVLIGVLALFSACTDMYDQPKYKPLRPSSFYADGSSRALVEGTVARGYARTDELLYTGKIRGKLADVFPAAVTMDVVRRGQDRFNTFCSPCHGRLGNGAGMIVQRGFPKPNSFLSDSVRAKPAGYYFDVITNGFGRMYSYAPSVPVEDRWAIITYIRALQLSQRTSVGDLNDTEQKQLAELNR